MNEVKKCPRCEWPYIDEPVKSLRDNKTDICPACSTEETIVDVGKGTLINNKREQKFIEYLAMDSEEK